MALKSVFLVVRVITPFSDLLAISVYIEAWRKGLSLCICLYVCVYEKLWVSILYDVSSQAIPFREKGANAAGWERHVFFEIALNLQSLVP